VTEVEEMIIGTEEVTEEAIDHQTTIEMIGTVATIEEDHLRVIVTTIEDVMIDLAISK
tara:strand:+ start:106 stop:279 length:174 start_codon:yes stop_codon:yes gene_type:complete